MDEMFGTENQVEPELPIREKERDKEAVINELKGEVAYLKGMVVELRRQIAQGSVML